ncbi:MAG: DUF1232 domain-containing protein [Rhodospirillales bacterium]|nr:DUF1232 domain-containing protein [Rhodospirillales bacterium]
MPMKPLDVSKTLAPLTGREDMVRRRFWAKVRRTLGRVPFMDEALAAFYAANDPATPTRVKAILFAALAYFIMPGDLIPDILAGVGFADDLTVLLTVFHSLRPYISDAHIERARAELAGGDVAVDAPPPAG